MKEVSMSAEKNQAPKDSRDVQGEHEGAPSNVPYWWGHQPIYTPNKGNRVKNKVIRLRNAKR